MSSSLALSAVFVLAAPFVASAQSGNQGSVQGTVHDSSGAVVPQASVTVLNESSGTTRTTRTDPRGFYAIESLEPGSYTVTVTAQGFSTSITKGEAIAPGQQRTSDATLAVGTAAEKVTVQANPVQVETQSSAIGSTITAEQVSNIMVNGRNFQALGQLAPGVSSTQSGNALPGGGLGGGTTLIVNGNSVEYTVYTIDGVEDMNTGNLSNLNILPITEAIQEFSILSDNYSAKYGFSGSGQILVQSKAGGAQYHGSAWDFLRNDALDANNYFDVTKASLHQNIYGYTFGGPVPKAGKTFFFAANEWRSATIGQTATGAVFNQAMRTGNFATSPTLPAGGLTLDAHSQALLASEGLTNCLQSPTQINPACLNTVSTTLYDTYAPAPNDTGNGFNNYINQGAEKLNQLDYDYRIDHSFTSNEILTGRALYEEADQGYPYDAWAGLPFSTTTDAYYTTGSNLLLRLNSIVTPKFDNIASVAYSDDKPRIKNTSTNTALPAGLSITQAFPNADPYNRIPSISISQGYTGLGVGTQPIHASDGEGILSDDVNWVLGNHVVQLGAMYIFGIKRQDVFTTPQGSFSFSGVHTGDAAADFLLGLDSSYSQNSNQKSGSFHYRQGEWYAQDDWKVTPKLTLNLGLRWFYFSQDTASGDQVTNFNPATFNAADAPEVTINGSLVANAANVPITSSGTTANLLNGLQFAGQNGVSSGFFTPSKNAYAPRIGFAYALGKDNSTSIRGGYGVGYTRVAVEQIYSMFGLNPPYNQSATVLNSLINNGTAGTAGAPSPQALDAINLQKVGPAQTQSYSLSVQHQLFPAGIFSAAYVGSVSRHLETYVYNDNEPLPVAAPSTTGCLASGQASTASYQFDPCINTGAASPYYTVPYKGYSTIDTQLFIGDSNYNSLQTHFVYRTPVLQVDTAYTYSKVLTDIGGSQGAAGGGSISVGAQDWRNLSAEYGPPDWDRRHVFTTSIVYNIPLFKEAHPLLKETLGGWTFAGLAVLESGFALSPGLSTATNGQASRPDVTGPVKKVGNFDQWFNTTAFAQAPYGFYGDASNGSIRGPAEFTGDTALYKTFAIRNKVNVQFRAEAFNVANHPNYAAVSTSYGAGNFGAVTSALDPRILEFALRASF